MSESPDGGPARRESLRVFLLLALTYVGFVQASTWGAACRFDLARALAEQGTIRIDDYHENTGDKAHYEGHYYSDKGPLPSFLAVPGVWIAHAVKKATGWPASHALWLAIAGGLATFLSTGLPTAAGGVIFHRILRERGVPADRAGAATFLVFLGTTLFPYATVLQGHAPAAAWLLLFFWGAFPAAGVPDRRRTVIAGVAASGALATEYLTGPALVILGVASLLRHRSAAPRQTVTLAAAALPGLVLLGVYHAAAFGSPFALGYQHVALEFFQEKMDAGLFGITWPDPGVALRLLFGPYRGLFFSCPILLLALPGVVRLLRDPARRLETVAALLVPLYYLLLNSGYSSWHGGWAIGPRHLVPGIAFLGLGLAFASVPRWLTFGVGTISVIHMLAATSVQPEVPEDIRNPLYQHLLPRLARAELSVGEQGFGDLYPARIDPAEPDRWDAFLIGEALRLPGHLALLPLALVWLAFWRGIRRPPLEPVDGRGGAG